MSSQVPARPAEGTRLVGLEIRAYKQLRDMWLPLSGSAAVFGTNGVGKSTLFECLALIAGSESTTSAIWRRTAQPAPGALAVVASVPAARALLAPTDVQVLERALEQLQPDAVVQGIRELLPMGEAVGPSLKYWRGLGLDGPAGLEEALAAQGMPEALVEWLTAALRAPVVKYALSSVTVQEDDEGDLRTSRSFDCTLLVDDLPPWLSNATGDLPAVLAPLGVALAGAGRGAHGYFEVMVLPNATEAPCVVEWLGAGRTGPDAYAAFLRSWRSASERAAGLRSGLADLPLAAAGPVAGDESWAVNEVAARAGAEEMEQVFPHLRLAAGGNYEPDLQLHVLTAEDVHLGTAAEEDSLFLRLSSGERRWLDEAVATASRAAEAFGREAEWMATLLPLLDADDLVDALGAVEPHLVAELAEHDYWTSEAFISLVQALRPMLFQLALRTVSEVEGEPVQQASLLRRLPGLQDLVQALPVLRLIDEPEVHLHSVALRRVRGLLESLGRAGVTVLIATHHPVFLSSEVGALLHLHATPEGAVLQPIDSKALSTGSALARDLGWTRGELLARVTFVLIVEGAADQLVLEELYGTELQDAGVLIVRMHGTDHLLATAHLDFVEQALAVPVGVLLDNVRSGRPGGGKVPTDEEKKVSELQKALRRQGRRFSFFGLERPDITAYIPADLLRQSHPDFPQWSTLLKRFRGLEACGRRPSFKSWLLEQTDVDLTRLPAVAHLVGQMREQRLPAEADLPRVVSSVLAAAASAGVTRD